MSLRARLVVAFTYVLVLVIVALEVPLALNLSKRVDAEIKSEARGQAQLVATGAAGQMERAAQLKRLVESRGRRSAAACWWSMRAAACSRTPHGPARGASATAAARRSGPR